MDRYYEKGTRHAASVIHKEPEAVAYWVARARSSRRRWKTWVLDWKKFRFLSGFIAALERHQNDNRVLTDDVAPQADEGESRAGFRGARVFGPDRHPGLTLAIEEIADGSGELELLPGTRWRECLSNLKRLAASLPARWGWGQHGWVWFQLGGWLHPRHWRRTNARRSRRNR